MLFGALALRFFQPQSCGTKALFFKNATPESLASRRLVGPECTPAPECIQIFTEPSAVAPGKISERMTVRLSRRHRARLCN
jgi:hypothetical protein